MIGTGKIIQKFYLLKSTTFPTLSGSESQCCGAVIISNLDSGTTGTFFLISAPAL